MKPKTIWKNRLMQISFMLIGILVPSVAMGGYVVKGIKGDVKVVRSGGTQKLTVGSAVTAADVIEIGQGAEVEILNEISKTIYTSTKSGRTTVSRMMLDAKSKASDNLGNVNRHMRFGGSVTSKDSRVYVETGMVKRAMTSYDPDASGIEIDPESLGVWLARVICGKDIGKEFPVTVSTEKSSCDIKKEFSLSNTGDYPIYFNVFNTCKGGEQIEVEVSEFGQPSGCYVLLPGHAIDRRTMRECVAGEMFIVGAPCPFDVDATLDAVNKNLHSEELEGPIVDMPVYIKKI